MQEAIFRTKKTASGRQRFSTALRNKIIEAAQTAKSGGQKITQIAAEPDVGSADGLRCALRQSAMVRGF